MSLPKRGTGLVTGRAGSRRAGKPRTEEERLRRHYSSSPNLGLTTNNLLILAALLDIAAAIVLIANIYSRR